MQNIEQANGGSASEGRKLCQKTQQLATDKI